MSSQDLIDHECDKQTDGHTDGQTFL